MALTAIFSRNTTRVLQNTDVKNSLVFTLSTDNGPDSNPDSLLVCIENFRFLREGRFYSLYTGAHAPNFSAMNQMIECQWTQASAASVGQHFGRLGNEDDFERSASDETFLKKVTEQGVADYMTVLRGCRTGGEPWFFKVKMNDADGAFDDYALLKEFCSLTSAKKLHDQWDKLATIRGDLSRHEEALQERHSRHRLPDLR